MKKLTCMFLVLCMMFTVCAGAAGASGEPAGGASGEALATMVSGATAPWFWAEIIGGLLVPFLVLAVAKNREKRGMVVLASVLVVLGVACKRVWLLFTSFIHPNVFGGPGITSGTFAAQSDPASMWMATGSFAPTVPECLVTLGVISVGVLIFMVLSNKLLTQD